MSKWKRIKGQRECKGMGKVQCLSSIMKTFDGEISIFEKRKNRYASDLKLKIFRQINSLDKDRLEEIYGVLVNFLQSKNDLEDWEKLTKEQRLGIPNAIEEIDNNKGIAHQTVMDNIRKTYTNG